MPKGWQLIAEWILCTAERSSGDTTVVEVPDNYTGLLAGLSHHAIKVFVCVCTDLCVGGGTAMKVVPATDTW